jgi:hypothetical protein
MQTIWPFLEGTWASTDLGSGANFWDARDDCVYLTALGSVFPPYPHLSSSAISICCQDYGENLSWSSGLHSATLKSILYLLLKKMTQTLYAHIKKKKIRSFLCHHLDKHGFPVPMDGSQLLQSPRLELCRRSGGYWLERRTHQSMGWGAACPKRHGSSAPLPYTWPYASI